MYYDSSKSNLEQLRYLLLNVIFQLKLKPLISENVYVNFSVFLSEKLTLEVCPSLVKQCTCLTFFRIENLHEQFSVNLLIKIRLIYITCRNVLNMKHITKVHCHVYQNHISFLRVNKKVLKAYRTECIDPRILNPVNTNIYLRNSVPTSQSPL
jgi:hypothetical protein